ncbi:hypothetical protein U1Q18_008762 [Sarracenia purpurea var. burkii]
MHEVACWVQYGVEGEHSDTTNIKRFRGTMDDRTARRNQDYPVDMFTLCHMHALGFSDLQASNSTHALGSRDLVAGISAFQTSLPDHMVPRRLKVQNSDIVWSGVAWICSKQLRHYPAFCRNETTISVHSFVYIMAEDESHYVGYVEDLYEDKKGQKKVKVRWFHHNREIKGVLPQLNPHPKEVFITPHVQVISAECIDGPATVLTPKHYEKCLAVVSHTSSTGIHMCFRQFKNNKVKPFSLSILRGYLNQAILSSLDFPLVSKHRTKGHKSNGEEDEDFTHDDHPGRGVKRNRSSGGNKILETGYGGAANSIPGNKITKCEPTFKKLRIKLSSRNPGSIKLVGSQPLSHPSFKVDEKIEVLCQDSGIRGCWFRCKVLRTAQKRLKVEYVDVQDAEGSGNLEEWVPASKMAGVDKLGMRCLGRLTIRPWPPKDTSESSFEVGAPVDAWWSDGWWEGVVMGVDKFGNDNLQVYFPGNDQFLTLQRKNIRTSRDWVGNRWVDIKAKPDVLAHIPSATGPSTESPKCLTLAEASKCSPPAPMEDCRALTTKLEAVEVVKQKLSSSEPSHDWENLGEVDLMKRLSINDKVIVNGSDSGRKEAKSVVGLGPANYHKYDSVKEMEVVPSVV